MAYLVVGDGLVDIAWQFDDIGNVDLAFGSGTFGPPWFEGLASFGRLILHDRRATGLSSRSTPAPNLETRAADLRLVLDQARPTHTVIGGWFESLAPGVLLAATDPDRVRGLVWWDPNPRTTWAPDYPWGSSQEELAEELRLMELWGTIEYARAWADQFAASEGFRPPDNEALQMIRAARSTCSPDMAIQLARIWWETDLRGLLPSVHTPTLLLADQPGSSHVRVTGVSDLTGEPSLNLRVAQYVASVMPNAQLKVIQGSRWPSRDEAATYFRPMLEVVQRFVGLEPPPVGIDSFVSSVLFTDIVGSTARQAALGDLAWKELLEAHHALVRASLARWMGVEVDTAGDGFFATFDGPTRAVRCGMEIADRVGDLGLSIRAGVHTGECELIDGRCSGLAVTIGARISALAGPSQVLLSQTVKDLVAGSGLTFDDAGEHELKGVPDRWHLYAASG